MEYIEKTDDDGSIPKKMESIIDNLYETPTDCIIITYGDINNTYPMFIYPITANEDNYTTFSITSENSKMLTRGDDGFFIDISEIEIDEIKDNFSKMMSYCDTLNHINIKNNTILILMSTPIAEILEDYYIEKINEKNQDTLEELQTIVNSKWN